MFKHQHHFGLTIILMLGASGLSSSFANAQQTTPTASPSPQASPSPAASPRPATIKLRAELTVDKKKTPIKLKRFFLLRKDVETINTGTNQSLLFTGALLSRTAYYTRAGASPQLIAWLQNNDCDTPYCREFNRDDLTVPEFRLAYNRGLTLYKNDEAQALKWLTVNLPDSLRIGYYNLKAPRTEDFARQAGIAAAVVTNEKGIAYLPNIPPGDYYVSNVMPLEIVGAPATPPAAGSTAQADMTSPSLTCVLWNIKVKVPPGKIGKEVTFTLGDANVKQLNCDASAPRTTTTAFASSPVTQN